MQKGFIQPLTLILVLILVGLVVALTYRFLPLKKINYLNSYFQNTPAKVIQKTYSADEIASLKP